MMQQEQDEGEREQQKNRSRRPELMLISIFASAVRLQTPGAKYIPDWAMIWEQYSPQRPPGKPANRTGVRVAKED